MLSIYHGCKIKWGEACRIRLLGPGAERLKDHQWLAVEGVLIQSHPQWLTAGTCR